MKGWLIAFDGHEVVSPAFKENLPRRWVIGMERVDQDGFTHQVLPLQHRPRGRNLIGFGRSNHTAQEPAFRIHRIDNLHPGMTHLLAVHNHDRVLRRTQDLSLPAQEHPLQQIVVHFGQQGRKDRLFGAANSSGMWVTPEFQGAQLPRAESVRVDGQVCGTAHHPLGVGHDDQANPEHQTSAEIKGILFGR